MVRLCIHILYIYIYYGLSAYIDNIILYVYIYIYIYTYIYILYVYIIYIHHHIPHYVILRVHYIAINCEGTRQSWKWKLGGEDRRKLLRPHWFPIDVICGAVLSSPSARNMKNLHQAAKIFDKTLQLISYNLLYKYLQRHLSSLAK